MTKTQLNKAVEELRLILNNLKALKPAELHQHIYAHNYGSAETKGYQMASLVREAERQLLNLEKSFPQINKDFEDGMKRHDVTD